MSKALNRLTQLTAVAAMLAWPLNTGKAAAAEPPPGDPVFHWQSRAGKTLRRFTRQMQGVWQAAALDGECAVLEEAINLENVFHKQAVTVWLAAEHYSTTPLDQAGRGQLVQACGGPTTMLSQGLGQHFSATTQAFGQIHQKMLQTRNTGHQEAAQALTRAWQEFSQVMHQFEGTPEATLDLEEWLTVPAEEEAQATAPIKAKLDEAVATARTAFRQAMAEARTVWATRMSEETGRLWEGAANPTEVEDAMQKANRIWLISALDALEAVRAQYRVAKRNYLLALEE